MSATTDRVIITKDEKDSDGLPPVAWIQHGDLSVAVTLASDGSGRYIVNLESMTDDMIDVEVTVNGEDGETRTAGPY